MRHNKDFRFKNVGVILLVIAGLSAGLPIQPRSLTSELPSTDMDMEITTGEPTTMDGINARSKRSVDLYGNLHQNLEQPQIGCPIQLTSAFVKSGYVSVPSNGPAVVHPTLNRLRNARSTYLYKPFGGGTTVDDFTLMTRKAMQDFLPLDYIHTTPASGDQVERIVRVDNKLGATVTNASMAARFVMKRWPPICSHKDEKIYDPPTYAQLMLTNDRNANYNGALLNVDVKPNGFEKLNFISPAQRGFNGVESECVADGPSARGKSKPSVTPSTLFMVTYLPCDTQ